MDKKSRDIEAAKSNDKLYVPETVVNGDILKQLLARSKYLLT
ncbi:hypothetical protein ACE1MK_13680 [Tenacibaculum maritimum]|nr:hypothetical protein [Tenacibaculum maritimum]